MYHVYHWFHRSTTRLMRCRVFLLLTTPRNKFGHEVSSLSNRVNAPRVSDRGPNSSWYADP